MQEHEAKLSVEDDFELPALEGRLQEVDAKVLAPTQSTITDVYYDTADLIESLGAD